jgi:transposase
MVAPMTSRNPSTARGFWDYVRRVLAPALAPGDIVVIDNLTRHKSEDVRHPVEAVGATVRFPPPYRPGFNPIEKPFAKLKALLRRAEARSVEALHDAIDTLVGALTADEGANFFAACGYDQVSTENALMAKLAILQQKLEVLGPGVGWPPAGLSGKIGRAAARVAISAHPVGPVGPANPGSSTPTPFPAGPDTPARSAFKK